MESINIEKFDEECAKFIKYVKDCVESEKKSILYLTRINNTIKYINKQKGQLVYEHTINMVANENLKKIYQLLKTEFSYSFEVGPTHTFGKGWSLSSIVGDHVMINTDSEDEYDKEWIYEECVQAIEENRKKKEEKSLS